MKVVEPFNRIESQTTVLSRLHATSDLLRRAARIQQLVKRLPGLDPLRTAHIISELGMKTLYCLNNFDSCYF